MHDSHQHLRITAPEWDAFMDDFQRTRTGAAAGGGMR
jgi:hypothetical protein